MRLVTAAILALALASAGALEAGPGKHAGHMLKVGTMAPPTVPLVQAPVAPVMVPGSMITGLDRQRIVVGAPVMAFAPAATSVSPVAASVTQEVQVAAGQRALVTRGDIFAVPLIVATPVLTAIPTIQTLQGAPVVLSNYVTGVSGPVLLRQDRDDRRDQREAGQEAGQDHVERHDVVWPRAQVVER